MPEVNRLSYERLRVRLRDERRRAASVEKHDRLLRRDRAGAHVVYQPGHSLSVVAGLENGLTAERQSGEVVTLDENSWTPGSAPKAAQTSLYEGAVLSLRLRCSRSSPLRSAAPGDVIRPRRR